MRAQDHSLAHAKKIRRRCTTRKRWLREDRDKLWDLRGRYPRAKWAEIKELGSFDRTPGALREEYRLQERQKQQQLNPSTEEERFVQPTPESNVVVLRLGARAAGHLGAMEGSAPANLVEQDRDDAMSISSGEDISHEYRTDPVSKPSPICCASSTLMKCSLRQHFLRSTTRRSVVSGTRRYHRAMHLSRTIVLRHPPVTLPTTTPRTQAMP
ncbi:hypothetical protein BJY04DRAFT_155648 [Aspergillus karnatakaensis]|uniref:uncharacterized protein n=1 Tax=Aspergillus karnatakaensis TaxID=1810916 RepID=UPI003CCCDEB5